MTNVSVQDASLESEEDDNYEEGNQKRKACDAEQQMCSLEDLVAEHEDKNEQLKKEVDETKSEHAVEIATMKHDFELKASELLKENTTLKGNMKNIDLLDKLEEIEKDE